MDVGVASDVRSLLEFLAAASIPVKQLAGHFHDTYGQAVANVWTAYQCEVRVFDSSVGGLGGCPYAPGAKGNVATEDLVYMFQQAAIDTGVNLPMLVDTGVWISQQLSKSNESRVGSALAAKATLNQSTETEPKEKDRSISWSLLRETEGLLIHRSGTQVKLTLNRPRNGNALITAMITNLTAFFEDHANDQSITRIAVSARGKYF